ncbi:DUF2304 domain-containing protein [Candidatus Woesearchaeota archaeon]|nr:DUF2304 domain-containing protein [Candidatus Woesearchaeota archaeon]
MVLGIQVLGVLFGLSIIYLTFIHYKRREFTLTEYGFWTVMALVFSAVAIFPGILDPIVESLSLARTMDLFIILGFMFLIAAVYYTYTVVRNNQKKVEEVVRKIALEKKK